MESIVDICTFSQVATRGARTIVMKYTVFSRESFLADTERRIGCIHTSTPINAAMNATVVSESAICSHISEVAVTMHNGGVTIGRCLAHSMIMTCGVGTLSCHQGVTGFSSCTTRTRARE